MPKYIDVFYKKIFNSKPIANISDLNQIEKIKIVADTEFSENSGRMTVEAIGLYLPEINDKSAIVYLKKELTNEFNPITYPLREYGIKTEFITEDDLNYLLNTVDDIFQEIIEDISPRQIRKAYKKALNKGAFDEILNEFNLERSNLEVKKEHKHSEHEIFINLSKLDIYLEAFFWDADLFKIWGKNHQNIILDADLVSRRVIKSDSKAIEIPPLWIENRLYGVNLVLRDAMNRVPPRVKSLDNQCKVFDVDLAKLNIKTDKIAKLMGLDSKDEIMKNIDLLFALDPNLASIYCAIDVAATHHLSLGQIKYINHIRDELELNPLDDISDTAGSNVSRSIKDLMLKHFANGNSEAEKIVKNKMGQSHINNLQSKEYNNHGVQPLRVTGGLLFSRVQRFPVIKGLLGDLDLKSCYATAICNLNVYLGTPIITTFKIKKYKPTLKEAIEYLNKNCPRNGWMVRVSGEFKKAINTILLSNLNFNNCREKIKTKWDKSPNSKSINKFNIFKTSFQMASSTIMTKEVKYAVLTADIWDAINLLPSSWVYEYENLLVDCIVFYPKELIFNTIGEYLKNLNQYPKEEAIEKFNPKTGLKEITLQYSQENLSLCFPVKEYYQKIRTIRNKLKNEKNPIQEVYKLFLNSGYGAFACIYLPVNNSLAANQITASARSSSWMMINFLNGFQSITDGCTFSWKNIPIGMKFKDILIQNPDYVLNYKPSIINNIFTNENVNQKWIDENFTNEMLDFYGIDKSHIPGNKFDYELKDEIFTDKKGNNIKSVIFTDFHNTGAGNYSKGMNGTGILIEGNDYDFYDFKQVKARSFKGKNKELVKWYVEALENGYSQPYIYKEKQVIKFGDGNRIAIKFLEEDPSIDELAHPMGFSKEVYKIMKLITRSQFLFKNEKQLKNFETTNYYRKLDCVSKQLLTKAFWKNLKLEDLQKFGVNELNPKIDYYEFGKKHPNGIGFEILSLGTNNSNIESVRCLIADKIKQDKSNFNAALNIDRTVNLARKFKIQFASMIVLKANEEERLKQLLIASNKEPTILTVSKENVVRLGDYLSFNDY